LFFAALTDVFLQLQLPNIYLHYLPSSSAIIT
jgi:hypothetical protein